MTEELRIAGGRGNTELDELFARHRVELLAHCYRLLGSVDESEDAVQETFLRAYRFRNGWEGRSSMRTWLYKIATNAAIDVRRAAARRPLPSDLTEPTTLAEFDGSASDVQWLEPIPDHVLHDERADPASQVAARAGMRLAFVAALQHLSPVQRAVLVLRDVLAMPAAEAAQILDLSVPAVHNHLQRARKRIKEVAPRMEDATLTENAQVQVRAEDYAQAFLQTDVDRLVRLLREDVTLEMPPIPVWFQGGDATTFLSARVRSGPWRTLATAANTQPALAFYVADAHGTWRPESLHVLDVDAQHVRGVVVFRGQRVFRDFGLPVRLSDEQHETEIRR